MQRGKFPFLRSLRSEAYESDVPGTGFSAVQKLADRGIEHRLEWNLDAPFQLFPELDSHALHLAGHGVAYYVVRAAKLQSDAKRARWSKRLPRLRGRCNRVRGTACEHESNQRRDRPVCDVVHH